MKKTKITKEFLIQDLLDTEANGFEENVIYPFWLKYSEEIKDENGTIIAEAVTEENFKEALNTFLTKYIINFIKSAKD